MVVEEENLVGSSKLFGLISRFQKPVVCSRCGQTEMMSSRMMIVRLALLLSPTAVFSVRARNDIINGLSFDNIRGRHLVEGEDGILTFPAIPHHAAKERRRLENEGEPVKRGKRRYLHDGSTQQVGALYQGYGTHYVDLWVGTPPQRQTVIVDTGSSTTGFPCSDCTDCGHSSHVDEYFQNDESETFQPLDCKNCVSGSCNSGQICEISMSYQEGSSWYAFEARDYAYLGGPHNKALDVNEKKENNEGQNDNGRIGEDPDNAKRFRFPLTFGCQTKITGLFQTQLADGIMGMENKHGAFFQQMKDEKGIDRKQFSLCFTRPRLAVRQGTKAGALTMGGSDKRLHYDPMVFAAQIRPRGFHTVKVRNLYLRKEGGESIVHSGKLIKLDLDEYTLNMGGVIIDSGTTDTYFNKRYGYEFRSAWKQITGNEFHENESFSLTNEELFALPTIVFQLYGSPFTGEEDFDLKNPDHVVGLAGSTLDADNPTDVLVAMPATHYLEYDEEKNVYTPRIFFSEQGETVLGANFMIGHDILFDVENRRIGFSESPCDYDQLVTDRDKEFTLYPGNPLQQATTYKPTLSQQTYSTVRSVPVRAVAMVIVATVLIFIGLAVYMKNRPRQIVYKPTPEAELTEIESNDEEDDNIAQFTIT